MVEQVAGVPPRTVTELLELGGGVEAGFAGVETVVAGVDTGFAGVEVAVAGVDAGFAGVETAGAGVEAAFPETMASI